MRIYQKEKRGRYGLFNHKLTFVCVKDEYNVYTNKIYSTDKGKFEATGWKFSLKTSDDIVLKAKGYERNYTEQLWGLLP